MKTKFLAFKNWGGQIKFATTLTIIIYTFIPFSFCQTINEHIEGESLWRNQGFGVSNHKFDIKNYLIKEMDEYPLYPHPITGSCSNEYYSTDYMPLYDDEDEPNNTLKIRPYSINNYADYTNGVNVSDLNAISHHVNGVTYFEDLSPTDDAPYRYISADAEYDNDVDLSDSYMIQDLLLGYRYDLERNSWEWVHKDEVENAAERFEEDPYDFVIDYNWPGSEGIILPALTTDEIQLDNDKFFTFRTTKVGDIVANSAWVNSSYNSWVCGGGSYFDNSDLEFRSPGNSDHQALRLGTILNIGVYLESPEDIYAFQLPISFSEEDFELLSVTFRSDYHPAWNYNSYIKSLVVMDFSKNAQALSVPQLQLLEFQLKSLHRIEDVSKVIGWHADRGIEILGEEKPIDDARVYMEILDIQPGALFVEARRVDGSISAFIESPKDQYVSMRIINAQGISKELSSQWVARGENLIPVFEDMIPGIYFIQVEGDNQVAVSSFIQK